MEKWSREERQRQRKGRLGSNTHGSLCIREVKLIHAFDLETVPLSVIFYEC